MEVTISIRRAVVVDDDVDALYIDTTAENIGGDQDTLLKRLERRVALDTTRIPSEPINSHTVSIKRTAHPVEGQSGSQCWGSCTRRATCRARLPFGPT